MRNPLTTLLVLFVLTQTVACAATTNYPSASDARRNDLSSRHTADRTR